MSKKTCQTSLYNAHSVQDHLLHILAHSSRKGKSPSIAYACHFWEIVKVGVCCYSACIKKLVKLNGAFISQTLTCEMCTCYWRFLVPFCLFLVTFVYASPVNRDNRVGAFYYLSNFGYIPKDANKETAALLSDEVITKAVKDFQVRIFKKILMFLLVLKKDMAKSDFDLFN